MQLSKLTDGAKISGAQWKLENVNQMLQLRASYLNRQMAV